MKKWSIRIFLTLCVLLVLITSWNLLVLFIIPPYTSTLTDSEGKLNRLETRTYLFHIGETRCFVDNVYVNKAISITFGGKAYVYTYNADHVLIDSISYPLS